MRPHGSHIPKTTTDGTCRNELRINNFSSSFLKIIEINLFHQQLSVSIFSY